jgi:hypothetical protein
MVIKEGIEGASTGRTVGKLSAKELRLPPAPRDLLGGFRQARQRKGITPMQALLDFMRIYSR